MRHFRRPLPGSIPIDIPGLTSAFARRKLTAFPADLTPDMQPATVEQQCGEHEAACLTLEHARALATDADSLAKVATMQEAMGGA